MAVRIRLMRTGRKNTPHFRVAVFDSRTRRDGRYLESLGIYEPKEKEAVKKITLNKERLTYWLGKGALLTPTLTNILKNAGISSPK
jgi:small subunit ribosomal protein S16